MLWRWTVLLGLLLIPHLTTAQTCPGVTAPLRPFAEEVLPISTTPVFLTQATLQNAVSALLTVRTAPLSYFFTQPPTVTSGHVMGTGAPFTLCGTETLKAFRAVRGSATTDAVLFVTYFKTR